MVSRRRRRVVGACLSLRVSFFFVSRRPSDSTDLESIGDPLSFFFLSRFVSRISSFFHILEPRVVIRF